MGTFFELYRIDKSKVPLDTPEPNMDVYESDNLDKRFFDLSIDSDEAKCLNVFSRTGMLLEVLEGFMEKEGLSKSPYNTSMVMSKPFLERMIEFMKTTDIWFGSGLIDSDKDAVISVLEDSLQATDFENQFIFYTYY